MRPPQSTTPVSDSQAISSAPPLRRSGESAEAYARSRLLGSTRITGSQRQDVDFHASVAAGDLERERMLSGAECHCPCRISHEEIPALDAVAAVAILEGGDRTPV